VDREKAVGGDRGEREELGTMPAYFWDEVVSNIWPVRLLVIAQDLETARKVGQAELRAYYAHIPCTILDPSTVVRERNEHLSRVATEEPTVSDLPFAFVVPGRG
jgi:hypothetical protein